MGKNGVRVAGLIGVAFEQAVELFLDAGANQQGMLGVIDAQVETPLVRGAHARQGLGDQKQGVDVGYADQADADPLAGVGIPDGVAVMEFPDLVAQEPG